LEINLISPIFSGKISVTALTPLLRHPKYPYIRGDTRGGGGSAREHTPDHQGVMVCG